MTIPAYSTVNPALPPQPPSTQAPHPKSSAQPSDSVHLSAAAAAALKGGDKDHDGDSR